MLNMDQPNSPALKQAADAYLHSLLRGLPTEESLAESLVLSQRFEHRMQRLILKARRLESRRKSRQARSNQPKTRQNLRDRKRLVAIMIIVMILASAFSVSASREAILGFVIQVYEKFSTITFDQPAQSDAASSSPVQSSDIADHFPKYLPEGYKVAEQMTLIGFVQIIYANESGRELIFIKQDKSGLQIGIDTEGIQTETVEVNLSQGIFYANKGQSNLIWSDERFAYSIIGILTKEELIKMASSIN